MDKSALNRLAELAKNSAIPTIGKSSERVITIKFDSLTGNLSVAGTTGMQFMEQLNLLNMATIFVTTGFVRAQIFAQINEQTDKLGKGESHKEESPKQEEPKAP